MRRRPVGAGYRKAWELAERAAARTEVLQLGIAEALKRAATPHEVEELMQMADTDLRAAMGAEKEALDAADKYPVNAKTWPLPARKAARKK